MSYVCCRKLERDTLRRTFRYTDAMVSDMVRQRGGSAQTLTQRRIGLKRELQIAQVAITSFHRFSSINIKSVKKVMTSVFAIEG